MKEFFKETLQNYYFPPKKLNDMNIVGIYLLCAFVDEVQLLFESVAELNHSPLEVEAREHILCDVHQKLNGPNVT